MILYRTLQGHYVEDAGQYYRLEGPHWDALLTRHGLYEYLSEIVGKSQPIGDKLPCAPEAPIENQEVWAAGVTYYRSRSARIEESKDAGGGDFYDRVYSADRPELFFKATPHRVAGPNGMVRIRRDACWSVPEPELALLINSNAKIVGYTVGNDMSSRDIEGANPLYLPQAKVYDQSCALGPGILIAQGPLPPTTRIDLEILRGAKVEFSASVTLAEMKRDPATLVEYLFRDNSFPRGCFLLTGTGIVPPDSFTLHSKDEIRITIAPIGTLVNEVA
ncbi:MAG: fumarylacetoacetate hydrolase family protein [Acidobacteriaceae bacterium]